MNQRISTPNVSNRCRAYGAWMFKIKPDNAADVNALMNAAAYEAHVASEAH